MERTRNVRARSSLVRVIFDRVTGSLELFVSSKNIAVRGSSQKSQAYCEMGVMTSIRSTVSN